MNLLLTWLTLSVAVWLTAELLPGLYHPTFLYEAVWTVGVALAVIALDFQLPLFDSAAGAAQRLPHSRIPGP